MSLISERFNSGTNGTNLQQGVNTSHTLVNPNNAATLKFSNAKANPFTNGLIAASTAGSGVLAEVRHDRTAATQGAQWLAFRVPSAAPTGSVCDIMQLRGGSLNNCGLRMHTDGSLRVLNMATEIGAGATYTNFISTLAGQDVIAVLQGLIGTTTANGRIVVTLRRLSDLSTNVYSYDSGTTRNMGVVGTDTLTSYRAGKQTSGAVLPEAFWMYGHDANDGSFTIADPTLFGGPPSGTLPAREVRHYYDFSAWTAKTSVAAVTDPVLTVNVAGFQVSITDDPARTVPIDVDFTVTGAGGNTVVSDTIPVGGSGATEIIEKVIASTATGSPTDWD